MNFYKEHPIITAQRKEELERRTSDLVAGLNGMTFDADGGNESYVRKITPVIRSALREAFEAGKREGLKARR